MWATAAQSRARDSTLMGVVASTSRPWSMRRRACTAQSISTSSVWAEPGPLTGTTSVSGRTSGRPAASGPSSWKLARPTTSAARAVAVNGAAYGLQAV